MTSLSDFRCALQNPEFPNGISHIRCHRTVFPSGKFGISVIPTTGEHHIISLLAPRSGRATTIKVFWMLILAGDPKRSGSLPHLLILEDLDHNQFCIVFFHKISSISVHNFCLALAVMPEPATGLLIKVVTLKCSVRSRDDG